MTDQTPIREQLLNAIDATFCQSLGYGTPEGLLAAYEASRTQTVDRDALRDRVAKALADEDARACGWGHEFLDRYGVDAETDGFVDALLAAVLPATTNHDTETGAPLSETERKMLEYALDLADEEIATDGSDFTDEEEDALAELRRIVTKPIATGTFELRGDTEIRAAALREAADEAASAARLFPDTEECATAIGALEGLAERLRRVADETAATETQAAPVQHAPGKVIRCPDCRDKGYTVCLDEPAAGARQDGADRG